MKQIMSAQNLIASLQNYIKLLIKINAKDVLPSYSDVGERFNSAMKK